MQRFDYVTIMFWTFSCDDKKRKIDHHWKNNYGIWNVILKLWKVSGYPEPEIIWSKDRHVMTDDELNGIITDRGALIFPAVTIENQGTVRDT